MAEIAKLERQAEAARRREATATVRWIRAAIAQYDIDALELGFDAAGEDSLRSVLSKRR